MKKARNSDGLSQMIKAAGQAVMAVVTENVIYHPVIANAGRAQPAFPIQQADHHNAHKVHYKAHQQNYLVL